MISAKHISADLQKLADPDKAELALRFFKTGKGEYGEGDQFLGIRVPVLRQVVGKFCGVSLPQIRQLLKSPWHEERMCALLLLVQAFAKGDEEEKSAVYRLYLDNTRYINNWDLVDCSAYLIVGPWLAGKEMAHRDKKILKDLAQSSDLWERRIAVIATFHFIRNGQFAQTLSLAEQLLQDQEDLMHKAVGWMLREIGKRDVAVETRFLDQHYQKMPRTMLRYAIEKFPELQRQDYLKGRV